MGKRAALLALAAVVCLAAVPSAALASRAIGVAPAGEVVKFTLPGRPMVITDSNGVVITCNVAYRETWAPRIEKVVGQAGAVIREGIAEGCVGGNGIVAVEAVILQLGMNTPKLYQSFRGMLPNITSILFIANPLRILIRYREVVMPLNTIGCLYSGPVGFDTGEGVNRLDRLIIQRNQFVPLSLQLFGTMPCPLNIKVEGTFQIEPAQALVLLNQ
ncbi:MAG TPA: hypothetical protein VN635_00570 [Conexibacter sp.]|nr:hypothetical protein [Conexibacter sp.]